MKTSEKNRTHPLVLGQCAKNSEEGEGYTIFKNTNKSLVAEIKALDKASDTWKEYNYKGLCKVEKELNSTQRLCVDEDGKYFIKNVKDFANTSKNNLLDEINNKFDVAEHINNLIGPLYTSDGYKKIEFTSYKDVLKENAGHKNIAALESHYSGWGAMGRVTSKEVGVHLNTYNGISLHEGELGGSSMFCHFNKDGNICNRDYNYDLKEFIGNKPKTRKDLIEEIVAEIPDVKYKHYGNKWFTDKFAFVLEKIEPGDTDEESNGRDKGKKIFNLVKLKHSSGDNYGERYTKVKMPKTTTPSTKNDILVRILPLVNQIEFGTEVDLSKYIDLSKAEAIAPIVSKNKRVQKTKINEKKFSEVFDWVNEKFILEEDDLMKALSNLENGIEVGESEDIIKESVIEFLGESDLPSFSFDKGQRQPNHDKYKGLVKLPHGCSFSFKVEEGDACEITWSHSIYYTDVVDFELIP